MTREEIFDKYPEYEFMFADGLDEAILGVADSFDVPRLVYSNKKCIEILSRPDGFEVNRNDLSKDEKKSGMTVPMKRREMAIEWFEYNTKGAYVGEQTPIWCDDDF